MASNACKDCNRQFILEPTNCISEEKKILIGKLLLEKIPLSGIARVVEVSDYWLQNYVNDKYDSIPKVINVTPKGKLTIQCDATKWRGLIRPMWVGILS